MRADLRTRLREQIEERARQQLTRRLRTVSAQHGSFIHIDGRRLLNFASNDYLGLAQHPDLTQALKKAADAWGVGATAAHLLGGHRGPHAELEQQAAAWLGYERALLFATGYSANLAVISTLLGDGDLCVQDKLNHACLLDGTKLGGARLKRYRHGDLDHAASCLRTEPEAAAMIASDAVFSMDGDLAPIAALSQLARAENALLYLDDAHGIGVLGESGRGSVSHLGLGPEQAPLLMFTLGKALGSFGALVLGTNDMIDGLLQLARPYVFSTAMPPAVAAASSAAIRVATSESWRRERLLAHIARFRQATSEQGWTLLPSASAIQPLLIGDTGQALRVAEALDQRGIYAPAIRYPTVPKGQARIRLTISAAHTDAEITTLLNALAEIRGELSM